MNLGVLQVQASSPDKKCLTGLDLFFFSRLHALLNAIGSWEIIRGRMVRSIPAWQLEGDLVRLGFVCRLWFSRK